MKAKLLTISAAVMALLAVSCQREETGFGLPAGEEVTVTISASVLSGGPSVKSNADPGNGDQINRCILGVYMVDGENGPQPYGTLSYEQVTGQQATFEDVTLLTGYDYKLVFWADNVASTTNLQTDNHYVTTDFPTVTYNDGHQYMSSDDTRDAFYGVFDLNDFSGEVEDSYTLTRPFGQLNIFTTDCDEIKSDALKPAKVRMTFTSIPTGMDLINGSLTEPAEGAGGVTGEISAIPDDVTSPVVTGARQLSFDYIFAPEGQQRMISGITMNFYDANDSELDITAYSFPELPVQRNYRTNVSGALLTRSADLTITISKDFSGIEEVYVLDESTRLSDVMTESELLQLTELKISGVMTKEDFEFVSPAVHVFSGLGEPAPEEYKLEILDLSEAEFTTLYPVGDEGRSSRNPNNVLTTVILPEGVESIQGNAFAHCRALSEINLPSTLKTMSVGVFYYAYALTEIELPDALERIGDACFLNSGITEVKTGTALTQLGWPSAGGVFQVCADLVSVDLSASTKLTEIMQKTFYNCSALSEILLPNSIQTISSQAFYGCSSLKQLTLPSSVTSICEDAFDRITGMTLTVEATVPPTITEGSLPANVFEKIIVPAGQLDAYKTAEGWADVADKIESN